MHSSRWWAVGPALCLAAAGCGRQETIESYRVPKSNVVFELNHVERTKPTANGTAGINPAARPQRTLAAIVPHGSQGWFFKLTAAPEQVDKQAEAFEQFVRSLKFEPGKEPKWSLPAGWRQLPGNEMRFATIQMDSGQEKPLELSVTSLPRGEGDDAAYLLANINRWRGQLQLASVSASALKDEMQTIELNGATAFVVDMEGTAGETGMGRGPFASGGMGPLSPLAPPRTSPSATAAAPRLKYDTPAGWQAGQADRLRKAAFEVSEGEQRVLITVIDLEAAAGDLLANVNRWREQVGLENTTQAELQKESKSIPVNGKQGHYVVLEGPGKAGKPQTIQGVIFQHEGRPWFIKLMGDAPLAAREKERFEAFVKSLQVGAAEANDGQ